jgi:hypothetical protein
MADKDEIEKRLAMLRNPFVVMNCEQQAVQGSNPCDPANFSLSGLTATVRVQRAMGAEANRAQIKAMLNGALFPAPAADRVADLRDLDEIAEDDANICDVINRGELKQLRAENQALRARLAAMGDTLRVDPDAAPPTLSPAEAVKQTIEHLTAGRVRGKPLADLGRAVRKAEGDQAVGNTVGRRSPVTLTEPGVPPRYGIAGPRYLG